MSNETNLLRYLPGTGLMLEYWFSVAGLPCHFCLRILHTDPDPEGRMRIRITAKRYSSFVLNYKQGFYSIGPNSIEIIEVLSGSIPNSPDPQLWALPYYLLSAKESSGLQNVWLLLVLMLPMLTMQSLKLKHC